MHPPQIFARTAWATSENIHQMRADRPFQADLDRTWSRQRKSPTVKQQATV